MKTSFISRVILAAIVGMGLFLAIPLFAQDDTDMLDKALDLVHQAWNPSGDAPSIGDRTDLLNQAMKLAQDAPQHHVRRHRVQAIWDIKAALTELDKGDPDNKAAGFIRDADSELRSALSIAQ